jgi:hypothetical protein
MKTLKIDFSEYYHSLICFVADFYQDDYIFLENKNFKTEPIKTPFNQYHVFLNRYLDLKYFKMEIS